jgi:periodic tryptophan protein 2
LPFLARYKNFRTLTAPEPVQFASLAVDPSGEVVAAGSVDPFHVYVWALQTGKLLDVLSGHKGPVSCLAFDSVSGILASGSWDKTVRDSTGAARAGGCKKGTGKTVTTQSG